MKYLFIFILFLITNSCLGTFQTDIETYNYYHFSINLPSSEYYHYSFRSNPIIFYPERYINDLGHEFPIEFFISGTYWKGGAWGSKNGFNQYYGNIYYYSFYSPEISQIVVPEPSSLITMSICVLLFRKVLKSDKKPIK